MSKEHKYSSEELRELAAAVADRLLSDDTLAEAVSEELAKKQGGTTCPKGTLCCSKGHTCSWFECIAPFRCSNGFHQPAPYQSL